MLIFSLLLNMQSHPTWVRGLKLRSSRSIRLQHKVAPYMGAWIETLEHRKDKKGHIVAPYMGAWIET